ncbi:hypothetical protein [Legionella waltersii]|uniref:Uncharacterized protein n=1 Tax=Legionella waltersii TaxID=66969 RepID=A0A0W1A5R6_9GAMM|nr:hypothetical protein [Legionella waltersii]KTD76584.1 hypothetical protein Lwal_2306 [Legionella waltersii]SNU94464.1 Uncharacterised protein [Legionella waltersii]
MNYIVTQQYARGEEKPIAAFNDLNEAMLFLTKKSSKDDEESKKIIYRLFDDQGLRFELNEENISISNAKYADANGDFTYPIPFIFQVMIQTNLGSERTMVAQFNDVNDAKLFVLCQFEFNKTIHDNDLFLIFKGKVLIDSANKTIIANRKKESSGTGSNYTLSPLSTRPTPGGGPADYWVENREDDENSQ